MATAWQPHQYLLFEEERTRPCRDLVAQIRLDDARTIIDLGCGPGNSTAVLAERWPGAVIAGLDSSPEMLRRARQRLPQCEWIHQGIAEWAQGNEVKRDLVFANAAMHWVTDHAEVYPRLLNAVVDGGVLATQVPFNMSEPAHQLMRDVAASPEWRERFPASGVREWFVHEESFYYDLLAPLAKRVSIWQTTYLHVLPGAEAITEWYRATGLRPFLDALKTDAEREQFAAAYTEAVQGEYRPRPDGAVLFPFRRLFVVATR
jgi:trans-aconitate 2-methyltransferase